MRHLAEVILQVFIRGDGAGECHVLYKGCQPNQVWAFDVTMLQARIVSDACEVLSVHGHQSWDSLVIENFTDNVKVCAEGHTEQLGFVAA